MDAQLSNLQLSGIEKVWLKMQQSNRDQYFPQVNTMHQNVERPQASTMPKLATVTS